MITFLDTLRQFTPLSVLLRLLFAVAIGFSVGYGRSRKQRSAGLRTYMLTSIGAALTILISTFEYEMLCGPWSDVVEQVGLKFDATRFSAQVIAGVGFLSAGTIIGVAHQQVSGLTTAIGLFATGCLGIAAGAGFFECVIAAVVIIILTMETLQPLEIAYKRRLRNITVYVEFQSEENVSQIAATITDMGAQIFDLDLEPRKTEADPMSAILSLRLARHKSSYSSMLSSIAELPCVLSVQELIA